MLKRAAFIMYAAGLLVLALPAQAQSSSGWTLALYHQTTGTITRVAPSGEVLGAITLPMPDGFDTYHDIALAPHGSFIAYAVSRIGAGTNPSQPSAFLVYDMSAQSIVATYDLNEATGRENVRISSIRFSTDGTRVLATYTLLGDANMATVELVALDAATGHPLNTLNDARLQVAGMDLGSAFFANVVAFAGDTATVILYPTFIGENLPSVAVNWNVVGNQVTPASADLLYTTDFLPETGDALIRAYSEQAVPTLPPDVVQLFNATTGEAQTVLAYDELRVAIDAGAMFVQGGARLLVSDAWGAGGTLTERDGTVLQEFPDLPLWTVRGTPEGFVYLEQGMNVIAVTTNDDTYAASTLYTAEAPVTSIFIQV